MSIRTRNLATAGILAIVFCVALGCASTPVPTELINARRAYHEAQQSPVATLSPAELVTARQALQRAETAFENEPDSQRTRDLAYVAERRAQWARAVGNIHYAQRQIGQAQRDYMATQSQIQQQTAGELARIQQQHATDQQKLAQTQEQIQAEREARLSAEQRAREAILGLGKVAGVRQDQQRGMVITLSGAVLFASAQSSLLPVARERLNQVAEALKQQPPEQIILIEGYTDSKGSDELNEELSLRRAQAVRDHLVARGVPADRIRAVGRGEASPVADNSSPEGRANNRRVEIVLQAVDVAPQPATGTTGAPSGSQKGQSETSPPVRQP